MRETFCPGNDMLKKYVNYIAFYEMPEGEREFFVFPNPGSAIGLQKEHSFISTDQNVYGVVDMPGEYTALLHVNRMDPVKVIDHGCRAGVTIVFHPLGICHFIPKALSELVEAHGGDPSYIPMSDIFPGFAKEVFSRTSNVSKLEFIEQYLLIKLATIDIPFVAEAINMFSNFDEHINIPVICRNLGTSSRNLARLFHKHICLSPVEFRNIYQFRFSLIKKVENGLKLGIKDLSYESNYSHSSYMIRMYKKYTGLNPSAFFNKISVEGNYVFMSL
jgi:AraC-like DNA-binding protein